MWSADRAALRGVFYTAWRHFREHAPLDGVEALVVEALLAHPEYQDLFVDTPSFAAATAQTTSDVNPFLHLGLHIAVAEQIATDRPPGVIAEWQRLEGLWQDGHRARHAMMECLEETLWEAQRQGVAPDDAAYIERLRAIPKGRPQKS
ncbi:DUF1841 family protein [Acidiferrobacter thiooxydans]|jgi:hypothetical protein|uniref:DUF1841 domain-containing protein n=1 Tax=Acidiferrobacter thiooxydans TaxID=163359 RepID=A0A1C2G4W9_9GAMM|nr:DUF1841 family protein [Acidiferrobacter thiooxydans]RCN56586.1 DUF1841 domain-containing protein [Acidiferrobacter thiooxydans]UEN99250.1 DUF1841 family protein [Acidiferrobacter thiooxydans]